MVIGGILIWPLINVVAYLKVLIFPRAVRKKYGSSVAVLSNDSFDQEITDEDENEVKKIVKEAMTSVSSSDHHMFSIPLEVSINSGNNWGEAH